MRRKKNRENDLGGSGTLAGMQPAENACAGGPAPLAAPLGAHEKQELSGAANGAVKRARKHKTTAVIVRFHFSRTF
jgi:hypothetical protein